MSHRPTREGSLLTIVGKPGTRNDPVRVAEHHRKMMGKYFRNLEPGRVSMPHPVAVKRLRYLDNRPEQGGAGGDRYFAEAERLDDYIKDCNRNRKAQRS